MFLTLSQIHERGRMANGNNTININIPRNENYNY